MSTKKQVRKKRQVQESERRKRRINPALAFVVVVITAVALIAALGAVLGDGRPEPPRPGAVWSPEHGHWH